MNPFKLDHHADSYLPEDKNWKLVWNDEFDGTELDRTKWGFRLNFWGKRFPTFTDEGVELDGNSHLRLHLIRKGNDFLSPHLQTGSLTYDLPKDTDGFWPFGKLEQPKFLHKYGYYEIRCRLPKSGGCGWHAAFWLQSPSVGAHPDPRHAGVECDIMESCRICGDGKVVAGNHWNGYGKSHAFSGHFSWDWKETEDGWHYYGVDWSPGSYRFFADRKLVGTIVSPEQACLKTAVLEEENNPCWLKEGGVAVGPISDAEQFILVSTECHGYRENGQHDPLLETVSLPDCFEVDHVRVFDEI